MVELMTMDGPTLDRAQMTARLDALDPARRASFAAACAEFLQPVHQRLAAQHGWSKADHQLRVGMESVWGTLEGRSNDLTQLVVQLEQLVPDVEDEAWTQDLAFSQNAILAAIYAAEACISGDPQVALQAAEQVKEAADFAAAEACLPTSGVLTPSDYEASGRSSLVQNAVAALDQMLQHLEAPGTSRLGVRELAVRVGYEWDQLRA